jgi:hypothetical protein
MLVFVAVQQDFQTFIDKFWIEAAVKYCPTTGAPSRLHGTAHV